MTDLEPLQKAAHGETRSRLIVDGLPAIVTLMRPDGSLEHANYHTLEYFGRSLEELKERGVSLIVHREDRAEVIERWAASIATGEPYQSESRLRRADGVYRWFRTRGLPLRDESGDIVLWYLLQEDIEEPKRAETLLAGEKQLLEMVARGDPTSAVLSELCKLVESTIDGCACSVVLVDSGGSRLELGVGPSLPPEFIRSINGRALSIHTGPCAMAAFLGTQIIAPDLAKEQRWSEHAWAPMALEHGVHACWSTPIVSTKGPVLGAFAIYYREPRSPSDLHQSLINQFTHIASIAIERMRSEEALRRSEALLSEAQILSSTGSFTWRVSTDVVVYSEQTYRAYGFVPGTEVTLELIASRIHPEDIPLLKEMVSVARGTGSDLDYEYRLRMDDGTTTHMHLVAHGFRNAESELEYIGAIQDVTQRKLAEEALGDVRTELARVARVTSLGALTASIAHEVNQPLSGIITNASTCLRMLAAEPPNLDGARETARRTIRDGNRASDVIARLRALFAKTATTNELLDLNEAADEVLTLLHSDLRKSRITVRADLAADLPMVRGDRVQLQQVVLNLVLNAADAMNGETDGGRRLDVETRFDEDRVCLTVRDSGVGFGPDELPMLFDPFYTTKTGGMGIGLSVSRSIIESHLGRLWADLNGATGAAFSFSLPCVAGTEIHSGRTTVRASA